MAYAEVGAHEIHLDLQFDPTIGCVDQYLDTAAAILGLLRAGAAPAAA